MGDMAEDFAFIKQQNKDRIHKNLQTAVDLLGSGGFPLEVKVCTQWHWQMYLNEKLLDYWPSRSRWRWCGNSFHGQPKDMVNFINKRLK